MPRYLSESDHSTLQEMMRVFRSREQHTNTVKHAPQRGIMHDIWLAKLGTGDTLGAYDGTVPGIQNVRLWQPGGEVGTSPPTATEGFEDVLNFATKAITSGATSGFFPIGREKIGGKLR